MGGGRRGEEAYRSPGLPALSEAAQRDPDEAGRWGNLSGSLAPAPQGPPCPCRPSSEPACWKDTGWLGPRLPLRGPVGGQGLRGEVQPGGAWVLLPPASPAPRAGAGGECLVFAAHVNKTGGHRPPAPAVGLHVAGNQGGPFLNWGAGEKLGTAGVRPETPPRRELCQLSDRRKAFYPIWHQTE